MRPREALLIDADEQLHEPVTSGIVGRRCNRVGPALFMAVSRDQHSLARNVLEGVAVQIESGDPRARRRGQHLADRQREEHEELCLLAVRLTVRRSGDSSGGWSFTRAGGRRTLPTWHSVALAERSSGWFGDARSRSPWALCSLRRRPGSNSAAATTSGGLKGWRSCSGRQGSPFCGQE